jgi:hypothetical protein
MFLIIFQFSLDVHFMWLIYYQLFMMLIKIASLQMLKERNPISPLLFPSQNLHLVYNFMARNA